MHDAAASTIAEYIGLIDDYGKGQGTYTLGIGRGERGDYSTAFVFGREAPDSPMAGGASYGSDATLAGALRQIVDECRLLERRAERVRDRSSEVTP